MPVAFHVKSVPRPPSEGSIALTRWLPLAAVVLVIIGIWLHGSNTDYESRALALAVYVIFAVPVSSLVAALLARSFIAKGTAKLLTVGMGALFWACAGTAGAVTGLASGDFANSLLTIHNTCAWFSALCHLTGATLSPRLTKPVSRPWIWLLAGYGITLVTVGAIVLGTIANLLPAFFISGQGPTLVRELVLYSTAGMLTVTGILFVGRGASTSGPFTFWYGQSLLFFAAGIMALVLSVPGTLLGWAGRITLSIGSAYMLTAVLKFRQEVPGNELIPETRVPEQWLGYAAAVAVVAAAAAVRAMLLPILDDSYPFSTFYVALAFAALFGGWTAGALATVLASLVASYYWIPPLGSFAFKGYAHGLGIATFLTSGALITWMADSMRAAQRESERARSEVSTQRDRLNELVQERTAELLEAQRVARLGHWHWEPATDELRVSDEILTILGRSSIPHLDKQAGTIFPPASWAKLEAALQESRLSGDPFNVELAAWRGDGTDIWLEIRGEAVRGQGGAVVGLGGTVQDISQRKMAEAALRQSEARFRAVAESLPEIIFVCSPAGAVEYVNSRWTDRIGLPREAALGAEWLLAVHPDDRERIRKAWRTSLAVGTEFKTEFRWRTTDETYRWFQIRAQSVRDCADCIVQWFVACTDIEDVKQSQAQLQHAALHDPLTSLPNRAFYQARLEEALLRAARHKEGLAALFVDLDHFKPINDLLGHQAGDVALQTVARRLQGLVRTTDMVARLGGDEFAVLLEDMKETEEAARVAHAVIDAVRQPIPLAGREVTMSASVGISCYPQDGDHPGELLRHADAAMYRAKQESRAAYRFFIPEINARADEKFHLANSLRTAVGRDELRVAYQPRVCLHTGRVLGLEALVRWQSPEHGLILPSRFIELAEEIGMIEPIGEWVLRRACQQYLEWRSEGVAPLFVSVNLSPRQFGLAHVTEHIREILAETGMPAEALELELTESVVMQNPARALGTLTELDALGIRLSLDDFGTGCSGLAYLKRFPISHLKIDQSFVCELPDDPEDVAIVRAVMALANSLKLGVTAEGIETIAQHDFLAAEGCEVGQGFLFSPPVSAEQMSQILRR